jgi:tetratricopeptide (TPR) repeat protein
MDVEQEIQSIIQDYQLGRMRLVEARCKSLLLQYDDCLNAQWLLLEVYLSQNKYEQLLEMVRAIVTTQSKSFDYVNEIATILLEKNQSEIAQKCYQKYLECHPKSAAAHFELAHLLKKLGAFNQALEHYQQSLNLKINQPETVHVNIAVIYSQLRNEQLAKAHLERALTCKSDYIPALFNLATLHEEWGEQEQAFSLYHKILQITPDNIEAITRIINAKKINETHQAFIKELEQLLASSKQISQIDSEAGHFALGKAYDDRMQFDLAFKHYNTANKYCAQRCPSYDSNAHEHYIQTIIQTFNERWIADNTQDSRYAPTFICGMFRSGTSLTEQILAAHSDVTSGGELSLLSTIIKNTAGKFPGDFKSDKTLLTAVSRQYKDGIATLFPNAGMVTDKRPDNFVYLGLLKAIFPHAKFICTIRNPLDVCLSVYFQHLGNALPYSTNLLDIAHYFIQYVKLLRHWKNIMPNHILIIDYDNLVVSQTPNTEKLLRFCHLPWQDKCLEFHNHKNAVKTASVWQVRQPMYQTSVHRSRHYASHLREVESYLAKVLPEGYADLL